MTGRHRYIRCVCMPPLLLIWMYARTPPQTPSCTRGARGATMTGPSRPTIQSFYPPTSVVVVCGKFHPTFLLVNRHTARPRRKKRIRGCAQTTRVGDVLTSRGSKRMYQESMHLIYLWAPCFSLPEQALSGSLSAAEVISRLSRVAPLVLRICNGLAPILRLYAQACLGPGYRPPGCSLSFTHPVMPRRRLTLFLTLMIMGRPSGR
ncbi:hypothetical protein C2E23DRAFT_546434 [Lenzites betulinus]|nr:hypothetical protein C2E23DRAFT_546434 [Lenzites betulinus]